VELGVQGLNAKATLGPAETRRLARRTEELGYRFWWAGEHVVLPSPRTADSPMDPTDPVLDPLVHLTYVAAVTETIELGTGIVILPQRNPVVLTKQATSLDLLSGGRLLLAVGTVYREPEMTVVGVASPLRRPWRRPPGRISTAAPRPGGHHRIPRTPRRPGGVNRRALTRPSGGTVAGPSAAPPRPPTSPSCPARSTSAPPPRSRSRA
jgi:Luciferase-like monooxygenase